MWVALATNSLHFFGNPGRHAPERLLGNLSRASVHVSSSKNLLKLEEPSEGTPCQLHRLKERPSFRSLGGSGQGRKEMRKNGLERSKGRKHRTKKRKEKIWNAWLFCSELFASSDSECNDNVPFSMLRSRKGGGVRSLQPSAMPGRFPQAASCLKCSLEAFRLP